MSGGNSLIIAAILCFCSFAPISFAQEFSKQPAKPDTLSIVPDSSLTPLDSLTVVPDTTRDEVPLDSIVTYSAERVNITFNPRKTILSGNAKVNYKSMELTAGMIEIDWDNNKLYAEPLPDSLRNIPKYASKIDTLALDSTGFDSLVVSESEGVPDSIRTIGRPKMADGDQVIVGDKMTYDIKSRRGKVIEGVTDYDDGFYHGKTIKRMDATTYNIRNGIYTTCNAEEPHYGFWSHDMKLIVKDRVIARPIVLHFGPVPCAILPFGVFPTQGGRHSGILIPTYGESSSQGRYFNGLGYFWAPNDYMDMRGSVDYYERSGVLFRGDLNYAQRYIQRGGVSGSYVNQEINGQPVRRWDMKIDHNHTLSPSANLNVNAYFVSDKSFLKDKSRNPNERLKQTIRSDATLSKLWPGTPYSASINLNHVEDLSTGNIDQSLPRMSFSRNQTPIIAPAVGVKPEDAHWWNQIYWRYGGSGVNTSSTRVTTLADESKLKTSRDRAGVLHNLSLTASTKPFGVFAFSPTVSYSEAWFDEWIDYRQRDDNTVDSLKQKSFIARRTFSTGAGLSTKMYGLFRPHLFGVEAIRHTLAPSLNLTYVPDFGEAKWGYYETFRNNLGTDLFYDRFAGNVFGGTPRREQMIVGMSVSNLFEYKRKIGGKEQKGELFDLGLSTSHNFKADSLRWSDLGATLRFKPLANASGAAFTGLGLDVSTRYSFYDQIEVSSGRWVTVNRPADGGLRLLGYDLTTSLKIQSSQSKTATKSATDSTQAPVEKEDRFAPKTWRPSPLPWSAGVGLRYGETRTDPDHTVKNAWANVNLEVQATKNWKLSSDMRVDLINKEIASTGISLFRDLHCWEGRFTWNPVGAFSGYYLIIAVKSDHLKDVKVEKREGVGGVFGL